MQWDSLSLYIIDAIYMATLEKREITTGELAKNFNHESLDSMKQDEDKESFIRKKTVMIRERLKVMEREGIAIMKKVVRNEGRGKGSLTHYQFQLLGDKILRYKFNFPNKKSIGIAVKEKNGKWSVFEL